MAYERIYERWSTTWTFVADDDSDVADIEEENPDAPVGSKVFVDNSGSTKIYMKFPAGSFSEFSP